MNAVASLAGVLSTCLPGWGSCSDSTSLPLHQSCLQHWPASGLPWTMEFASLEAYFVLACFLGTGSVYCFFTEMRQAALSLLDAGECL